MDSRENIGDAYERACARERELWHQVRNRLPGEPDCPADLWHEWLRMAQLVRVLSGEQGQAIVPPKR